MADMFSSEKSPLTDLMVRAADLRLNKAKAEKEAIDAIGKDLSPEEKAAIEKKRREIFYQLEVEGAAIEKEFAEKYRAMLIRWGLSNWGLGGGLHTLEGCTFFCQNCYTSCTQCVTSCTQCISPCPVCVTPCTNAVI